MADLREAEPRDIRTGLNRALRAARGVKAGQNDEGAYGDLCRSVQPRRLAIIITKLEEASLWLNAPPVIEVQDG